MRYDPVHFVTKAKAASNPSGLKNVARMRLIVSALFFTIRIGFHEWIFLKNLKKTHQILENFAFVLYIKPVIEKIFFSRVKYPNFTSVQSDKKII